MKGEKCGVRDACYYLMSDIDYNLTLSAPWFFTFQFVVSSFPICCQKGLDTTLGEFRGDGLYIGVLPIAENIR